MPSTSESSNPRKPTNRVAALSLVAAATFIAGACSFSFGSGGDSAACEKFTEIATEIESADMSAPGLESSLETIHSEAKSDGQDDVASAAEDLTKAVKANDTESLYDGLGEIEAACGPYGY